MTTTKPKVSDRTLSTRQVAMTLALVAAAFFILCWSAGPLPGSVTLNYVRLFTNAESGSSGALIEGIVWSVLAGYAIGAVAAVTYNMLGSVRRRQG
jgi:hypothetical protein